MRVPSHFKHTLLAGTSLAAFALVAGPAFAQDAAAQQGAETVIVTGTRVQGMTAQDSAAPITVLGTEALTHGTGTTDLRAALGQTIPSFTAQQFGSDTANLTLSAALRGLSPNDTLVLVNGKRRHYSGNLHVDSGGFAAGSNAPDISMIPEGAIDHVEVLLDGAAAQYGTDAISGVVNIILKNKASGGQFQANAGQTYGAEGQTYDLSYNMGLPLFDKGFVNFTVDKQYQNFSQNGGPDNRYVTAQGQPVPQSTVTGVGANGVAQLALASDNKTTLGNQIPDSFLSGVTDYPRSNRINGSPESQLTMGELNAAYDFSDNLELYAFGTIGHKFGKSYENDRLPNQIIATMGSNQPCSATNLTGYNTALEQDGVTPTCAIGVGTAGTTLGVSALGNNGLNANGQVISSGNVGNLFSSKLINAKTGAALSTATGEAALGTQPELVLYPSGFQPLEVLSEDDYQYNTGMKFNVLGWALDANVGYGKDIDKIYVWNTGNRSLFLDTHSTPTNFYEGSFTASQFTGSIDATHPFNVGLASPLTVALGVEAREDTYGIGAGEPDSYYKEGPQSFPGFQPSNAGTHSRKNYAGYIDFAVAPIEQLQIDVAGRAEHYTDFGDTQIGKITARYDINDQWAVRGTVSTGFRAPTLAEEFYTATNVAPTYATVQLPADSAAAKILGLQNLKPESSTSYSLGLVAHPIQDLSATVDVYSIALGNRIVASSTVTAKGGAINTPLVSNAIAALGVSLDPTAAQQGVTAFLNGLATVTQGVDATVNYPTDFGQYGLVNWTFAGNYNQTAISSVTPPPAVLTASNANATFFQPYSLYNFVHSAPAEKIALTADWTLDQFGVTARETFYGPQHGITTPNAGGQLIQNNQAAVGLFDLEARYNVTDQLQLAIGGNNLFNIRPDQGTFAQSPVALNGNNLAGEAFPAGNGNVVNSPLGTAFNPNGGYYYGRISFNF